MEISLIRKVKIPPGKIIFNESIGKSSKDNENNVRKQPADPLNTFQTFMNRLNKLQINSILPNSEPIRFSDKAHGIVKGFSVCTNQGLVRNYNEDRVSIILNISRPPNKPAHEYWPNCSMFGVFDGHGGSKCAEFLRNNLHQFVENPLKFVFIFNLDNSEPELPLESPRSP